MDEVKEFINNRFPYSDNWLTGNCYYFAVILKSRFPHSNILYDLVRGHFFIEYDGRYYDWTGEIYPQEKSCVLWDEYRRIDKLHYERIVRDCVL